MLLILYKVIKGNTKLESSVFNIKYLYMKTNANKQLLVICFNSYRFFPICVSFHHRPNFYRFQRTETAVITKSVTFNRVGVTSHKSVTYRFAYRNGLQFYTESKTLKKAMVAEIAQ